MPAPALCSAFGETMSLRAWAKDPRCVVSYGTLAYRLRSDWLPEEAITTPPTVDHGGHSAFGETKSLREWAEDPRCEVAFSTLAWRVTTGSLSLEDAVTTPRTPDGHRRCTHSWR